MQKDERYHQHYTSFIKDLLQRGYAESLREFKYSGNNVWYIPHQGVYTTRRNQICCRLHCIWPRRQLSSRVTQPAFLQCPDQTNGVLSRFRQNPIAFACVVEAMFHQFFIIAKHGNYLRFLRCRNGDVFKEWTKRVQNDCPPFGATSSPGCANYGVEGYRGKQQARVSPLLKNLSCRNFWIAIKHVFSKFKKSTPLSAFDATEIRRLNQA